MCRSVLLDYKTKARQTLIAIDDYIESDPGPLDPIPTTDARHADLSSYSQVKAITKPMHLPKPPPETFLRSIGWSKGGLVGTS